MKPVKFCSNCEIQFLHPTNIHNAAKCWFILLMSRAAELSNPQTTGCSLLPPAIVRLNALWPFVNTGVRHLEVSSSPTPGPGWVGIIRPCG